MVTLNSLYANKPPSKFNKVNLTKPSCTTNLKANIRKSVEYRCPIRTFQNTYRFSSSSSSDGPNNPFGIDDEHGREPIPHEKADPNKTRKKRTEKAPSTSPLSSSPNFPADADFHHLHPAPLEEHEAAKYISTPKRDKKLPSNAVVHDEYETEMAKAKTEASKKKQQARRCKQGLEILDQKDSFRRVYFAAKMLFLLEDVPEILNNLVFTDECNFNLPNVPPIIAKPPVAESEKLPQIAWCGMSVKGALGPYFFNSHVTDKTYLKMLETYVIPELERQGYDLKEVWFQQDGAAWHRSRKVLDFLQSVFDYRLISLGTKFIWPPRSQDLTPMDYFFWDHIKDRLNFKHSKYELCFQSKFRDILTNEVADVKVSRLKAAIYELPKRLDFCVHANGERFKDLMANPETNFEEPDGISTLTENQISKPTKNQSPEK
ncbi:hypothetical protein Ocin01_13183 [Orchesella cincta]|uniref:Transposable element Tc3 transposase n=1 Tax=Orchesella cincta TaxID=48709 RepID=A0A1D2MKV5_ORCCI|nr:hypothetical protein Ocin01_13183 [Orchesella cincta]